MAGKVPWGALGLGAIGVAAGVRAFWRPERAIMKDGQVVGCAGASACNPSLRMHSATSTAVFAVSSGSIVEASPTQIVLASSTEPVLLVYAKAQGGFIVRGRPGKVRVGEHIADVSSVDFSVYEIQREGNGSRLVALEPAAWLAARGLKTSAKKRESVLWCATGRKLVVPKAVAQCNFELPEPTAAMLLPVSVTTA